MSDFWGEDHAKPTPKNRIPAYLGRFLRKSHSQRVQLAVSAGLIGGVTRTFAGISGLSFIAAGALPIAAKVFEVRRLSASASCGVRNDASMAFAANQLSAFGSVQTECFGDRQSPTSFLR